jgi:hypothetical protein
MAETLRSRLRESAPDLTKAIDELCQEWLGPLEERLGKVDFRPKQINDAVWGTIELLPWEVALLDTPMLQRMRGVRQLGLAHLVFPGAVHDRLEHILGVVGAVDLWRTPFNGMRSDGTARRATAAASSRSSSRRTDTACDWRRCSTTWVTAPSVTPLNPCCKLSHRSARQRSTAGAGARTLSAHRGR